MAVRSRPAGALALPAGFSFHALVAAGGRSERFGGVRPKQFVEIGSLPVVAHALARLLAAGATSVVVALPEVVSGSLRSALEFDPRVCLVAGGASRQASVAAALARSPAAAGDWIAVHDGARPATAAEDLRAVLAAALGGDGAVLGRSVSDTLKETRAGKILRTVDRSGLFRAETPQVFRRHLLERALDLALRDGFVGSDEASVVERLGAVDIAAVEARRPNPKLTRREDLADLARLLGLEHEGNA